MADGTYERRGPREAELKRFERLLALARRKRAVKPPTTDAHPGDGTPATA